LEAVRREQADAEVLAGKQTYHDDFIDLEVL
ncbi:hypothetical protein LCGC14_1037410, partial [marine sediment metagenome]